jgi:hypothetical protein
LPLMAPGATLPVSHAYSRGLDRAARSYQRAPGCETRKEYGFPRSR